MFIQIIVENGAVASVWSISDDGMRERQLDRDEYTVEYAQRRTERCAVCDRTYPPSEIVTRAGEQLCQSCDLNKYPIRDEDIPY